VPADPIEDHEDAYGANLSRGSSVMAGSGRVPGRADDSGPPPPVVDSAAMNLRREVAPDEWLKDHLSAPASVQRRFPILACIPGNGEVRGQG